MTVYSTEKVLFWGGIYSQWYRASIIIDGIKYNCNEQYMMAEKARLFGDDKSEQLIMATSEPSTQKALGKKVKNFDKKLWEQKAQLIVFRANWAKFTQHKDLFEELMKTGNKEIVEASPEDVIWGIGLHETDIDCLDNSKWKGTNWLGIAIMQVRAAFN